MNSRGVEQIGLQNPYHDSTPPNGYNPGQMQISNWAQPAEDDTEPAPCGRRKVFQQKLHVLILQSRVPRALSKKLVTIV